MTRYPVADWTRPKVTSDRRLPGKLPSHHAMHFRQLSFVVEVEPKLRLHDLCQLLFGKLRVFYLVKREAELERFSDGVP